MTNPLAGPQGPPRLTRFATIANPELCAGRNDDEDCATKIMAPLISGIGRAIDHLQEHARSEGRFTSRVDLTRVGVFGHSFGGAQAAQFCSQDTRCKAGINIDGRPFGTVITNGIPVPFMFLLSDHGTPKDMVSQRIMSQIQAIYDRQPHDSRLRRASECAAMLDAQRGTTLQGR